MRRLIIWAVFGFLTACATAQASAPCVQIGVSQAGNPVWEGDCGPAAVTATPTESVVPPTDTAIPPSATPAPTLTPTVTPAPTGAPTDTPAAGSTPFAGAPLCATHDDGQWHALWDSGRACHYDHEHAADPAQGDAVFGPAAAGGQTVSYPWMTANENSATGHPGYKYAVNIMPEEPVPQEGFGYLNPLPNYVTAFRVQYHDAGGNAHMVKRFHSYYLEARILSRDGTQTGIVRIGGWADYGCLHLPYKQEFLLLPGIDPVNSQGDSVCGTTQSIHADPYRAATTVTETTTLRGKDNVWTWTSHDRYGYNRLGYFFFRTLDTWGGMDGADPRAEHFICPAFDCRYNNSERHVYTVIVQVPASLDTDGDGLVSYSGFTDLRGNIVTTCTAPGPECVPVEFINAPVGLAVWSRGTSGPRPAGEVIVDHDVSPPGEHWIEFPN